MDLITFDTKNCIITAIIALTTYYMARFYMRVKSFPPGPLPLPIVGNILMLRGTKEHVGLELAKLRDKYGPVVTFWTGFKPSVFVYDSELAKDTFKLNAFSGRPKTFFGDLFTSEKSSDIVFDDFGHRWESLRRVAHSAVRKYAVTDKLAYLVSEVVDEIVAEIKNKEGINKPFNIFEYNYRMFLNILSESAFGKRYKDPKDPEFKLFEYFFDEFQSEIGPAWGLIEFLPIARFYYRSVIKKTEKTVANIIEVIKLKYIDHYESYDENIIRDFCDALISAKNEALNEDKESKPYLTDDNLALSIVDLFMAGIDTSQTTLKWIILFMANYPEMQNKMRQEIESVIGDRMPVQEDRNNCHYVNAFISETMRYRPIIPMGVIHKNVVQSKIGEYTIPSDTMVFYHQHCIMNDPKYWNNPQDFRPERFLENGKYLASRPTAFIPFGTGRRVCLGEKLAINDVFLVLVRLLQSTNEYEIALDGGPGSADMEPDCNLIDISRPNDFKIIFKYKN